VAVRGYIAAALVVATSACGIAAETEPREITEQERPDLAEDDAASGSEGGTVRVYMLVPENDQGQHLRAVNRNVELTPESVVTALLEGPTAAELGDDIRTALPSDATLRSARVISTTLVLDFSGSLAELTGERLIDALAQLVWTTAQINGVSSLRILVDGEPASWPTVSGELTNDELTVFDFQGVVRSSQPDFPAVPTPQQ
jgi:spore germination protein GerM